MEPQTTAMKKQKRDKNEVNSRAKGRNACLSLALFPVLECIQSTSCLPPTRVVLLPRSSHSLPSLSIFTKTRNAKREQSITSMIKSLIKHKSEHAPHVDPSVHRTIVVLSPSSPIVNNAEKTWSSRRKRGEAKLFLPFSNISK